MKTIIKWTITILMIWVLGHTLSLGQKASAKDLSELKSKLQERKGLIKEKQKKQGLELKKNFKSLKKEQKLKKWKQKQSKNKKTLKDKVQKQKKRTQPKVPTETPKTPTPLIQPKTPSEQPKAPPKEPKSPSTQIPQNEEKTTGEFARGTFVTDCLNVDTVDDNACLFFKNPVYQNKASMEQQPLIKLTEGEGGLGVVDVSHLQTYSVLIPGQELKNSTFDVDATGGKLAVSPSPYTRAKPMNGQWKFDFHNDPNFNLVQVMTYYWLNLQAQEVKNRNGTNPIADKNILVVPLATGGKIENEFIPYVSAVWMGKQSNAMVFGVTEPVEGSKNTLASAMGLDASIVNHEGGHAVLDYSAPGNLGTENVHQKECAGGNTLCCNSTKGCLGALHEGIADVHTHLMFSDGAVGELFTNDLEGFTHCGQVSRNKTKVREQQIKVDDLYGACKSVKIDGVTYDASGEIHAMGTAYATIWVGLLERAKNKGLQAQAQKLFFEHLKTITDQDDFYTVKDSLKTLDQNLFQGQFSQDINEEYQERGL